ncbi:hypothetical protein BDV95DRAFT_627773 [Massariosphaeria phaeospora]|uniref:Uncharacterized protein n=1 Tax=Massariosphaeria phaeospora TaxID=100035 RepID=A0A7C8IBG8_9PLEO|nr:hypothetical protein BDV95DRAFT_627773 [Massariosphaeria phaeospora]
MHERQLLSSRKRQRSEPSQPDKTSQPISKKQRLDRRSGFQTPAAFWDNLSKVWLTKRALRELDRRNSQAPPNPPSPQQRARRPVTRNFLAESKRSHQAAQYTADYLCNCGPKILTDIKLFARHGGPDLSDLRNYPEPIHPSDHTMSSSQSNSQSRQRGSAATSSTRPTTNTLNSKSTGVYDRVFQQKLIDNAVYPDAYEYPDGSIPAEPSNLEDLNRILAQPRPSLSPSRFSDEEFRRFRRADAHAAKEKQVSESAISIIEGKIADLKCRSGGIPFTNLDDLVNSDPLADRTLKPGNPDIYYGARPEQLSREVRDELSGRIVPSTQHDLPMAPNFFLACYDGALGARGMHSLRSYRQDEPVYDNNAYAMTSIYHGGTLKMYTSHVAPPRSSSGSNPEYHMSQINTWGMTGNANTFRQGARAYRNLRDWAKEQRDEAITRANERANPVEAEASAAVTVASPALSFVTAVSETEAYTISQESQTSLNVDYFEESDSSIEELADHTLPTKRSSSRHPQTQRKRRNAGESSGTGHSHGSAVTPASESSSASNAIIEQSDGLDIVTTQDAYLVPRAGTPVSQKAYDDQFAAALKMHLDAVITEHTCRLVMYHGAADEWPIGRTPPEVKDKRKAEW